MLGRMQCKCVNTIKPEIILNYMLKFNSYLTENTLRLDFAEQPITAVQGRQLSVESYTKTNVDLVMGKAQRYNSWPQEYPSRGSSWPSIKLHEGCLIYCTAESTLHFYNLL